MAMAWVIHTRLCGGARGDFRRSDCARGIATKKSAMHIKPYALDGHRPPFKSNSIICPPSFLLLAVYAPGLFYPTSLHRLCTSASREAQGVPSNGCPPLLAPTVCCSVRIPPWTEGNRPRVADIFCSCLLPLSQVRLRFFFAAPVDTLSITIGDAVPPVSDAFNRSRSWPLAPKGFRSRSLSIPRSSFTVKVE